MFSERVTNDENQSAVQQKRFNVVRSLNQHVLNRPSEYSLRKKEKVLTDRNKLQKGLADNSENYI